MACVHLQANLGFLGFKYGQTLCYNLPVNISNLQKCKYMLHRPTYFLTSSYFTEENVISFCFLFRNQQVWKIQSQKQEKQQKICPHHTHYLGPTKFKLKRIITKVGLCYTFFLFSMFSKPSILFLHPCQLQLPICECECWYPFQIGFQSLSQKQGKVVLVKFFHGK